MNAAETNANAVTSISNGSGNSGNITSNNSNTNSNANNGASDVNLYDEYKRRLELIKKIKPVK